MGQYNLHTRFGKLLSRFLGLSVLAVSSVTAAGVNCNNQTGDGAMIQVAVNAGGTVVLNGSCALGNSIITVNNPVTITGSAQLNSTSANAFVVSSDNVSISGLTFNGAGLWLNKTPTQTGFIFTRNTIQNTHGANAISADGILIKGNISGNTFTGIAPDGFANATFASLGFGACYTHGGCDTPGVGIQIWAGIDQTIIENNHFDLIANDGMHIGWNAIGADSQYFLTKNNSISYNTFSRVHRIGIEAQAIWAWPNCGFGRREQCDAGHDFSINTKIAGNYFHDAFLSYVDTYAYSLALSGPGNYINNAGLANVDSGPLGYGIEDMGQNVLTQGNVIASNYLPSSNPHGWGADIIYGAQRPGTAFTTQNNILCGDKSTTKNFGREPFSSGAAVNQYNFIANTCPNAGALTTSNIALAFVAPDQSPTTGIWNITVNSALPIKNVQFFIDGSQTPLVTQEIQDVSTTFATDRNWLYHANVEAATLAPGAHTITATATDVSGTIKSITQSLTGGGPIIDPQVPVFQATPNPLAFGSQLKGTPSAKQTVTITNTGSAPLVISDITLGGANAPDFQAMNNCNSPLAANLTCMVTAIFRPTTTGAENAFLSFADNTADTPHQITLSGTGTAAPLPIGPLPTNLPKGMILWLANDIGVEASATGVSAWRDQSGNGADALQGIPASQPTLVAGNSGMKALAFDGKAQSMSISGVPINGLTGMTVFIVSSADVDVLDAGYGLKALLYWPESASWGGTYFGTYQTSAHFRFGTTQAGNENTVPIAFSRTQSFGLNEWVHNGTSDTMLLNGRGVGFFPRKQASINGVTSAVVLGSALNNSFFSGDVSEILVYNRALSDAERQAVEGYLMGKYRL